MKVKRMSEGPTRRNGLVTFSLSRADLDEENYEDQTRT